MAGLYARSMSVCCVEALKARKCCFGGGFVGRSLLNMKNGEICDILDLVHNLKKFQLKIQNLFFAFYFRVLSHFERSEWINIPPTPAELILGITFGTIFLGINDLL